MKSLFSLCVCASAVIFSGCKQTPNSNRVVLYCSVDDVYARPLIDELEKQTGLEIEPLFDTEATKTAGLANKIRAERNRPRADVFWSSALLQTLLMSDEGLLEAYQPPTGKDLPARFQGKDWTGVGVRARVLVTRTPQSFDILSTGELASGGINPVGISNPQFGTASDWATAFATRWGTPKALNYFTNLQKNDVRILPGNGDVARQTAQGDLRFGVTDSDDYLAQIREKKPLVLMATTRDNVLVPGAASVLKGAPNAQNARKLLDAIVSRQNEARLIQKMPGVFSLRRLGDKANWRSGGENFDFLVNAPVDDYQKWPATWRAIRQPLARTFASK